jgi:hypothetical protein
MFELILYVISNAAPTKKPHLTLPSPRAMARTISLFFGDESLVKSGRMWLFALRHMSHLWLEQFRYSLAVRSWKNQLELCVLLSWLCHDVRAKPGSVKMRAR